MRATIQGELHVSGEDRESLLEEVEADADALFVEQRADTITPDRWTFGYVAFVVGALLVFWLQAVLYRGPDVREQTDLPVHDDIDTPLPALYPRIPLTWRLLSGAAAAGVFAYGLFLVRWYPPLLSVPDSVTATLTLLIKPVIVLGAFLIFSFTMVFVEERAIGGRDGDMADAITETAREENYETVVVSCGEAHLDRLSELLEERGWDVSVNRSTHESAAILWHR